MNAPSIAYYDHERDGPIACRSCGWTGLARDHEQTFDDLLEVRCPRCTGVLVYVVFPTLEETRTAAASGNAEAIRDLPEFERQEDSWRGARTSLLASPDQLPELPDEPFVLAWDLTDRGEDDERWQVIRHGATEIWREVAFYESYPRYEEVLAILHIRYGPRLLDLEPSEASTWWLYGDRLGLVGVVDGLRRPLKSSTDRGEAE